MDVRILQKLLADVASGDRSPEEALAQLSRLPYHDSGFVKQDHHRSLRNGFSEVIFCEGKEPEQLLTLIDHALSHGDHLLGTRASQEQCRLIEERFPHVDCDVQSRTFRIMPHPPEKKSGHIGVLAAGTSDLFVAEEACRTAEFFGAEITRHYDVGVAGLHRLLSCLDALHTCDVIIVIAGMEGALPSVVGGLVAQPIIAVPTSVGYGASYKGLAALLGMLNSCSEGITVVNIDNGFGASCAAMRILRRTSQKASSS